MSANIVLLIGSITGTGEVQSPISDDVIFKFTVTTTTPIGHGGVSETVVHRCVAVGQLGANLSKMRETFPRKVYVEGRIMAGAKREIMARRVDFIGPGADEK